MKGGSLCVVCASNGPEFTVSKKGKYFVYIYPRELDASLKIDSRTWLNRKDAVQPRLFSLNRGTRELLDLKDDV